MRDTIDHSDAGDRGRLEECVLESAPEGALTATEGRIVADQRLALVLEAADLGTWERDLASDTVLWSPRQAELFGYPRTVREATYAMWRCRVHPQDVAGVEQCVQRALRTGENYHCEYRVVWPDGSIHWVEGHGGVLTDASGRPTRTLGTARDITPRKQLEIELRQARDELDSRVASRTAELRQSEEQYRLLAEHGTDMISRISPEGIYRYASPACRGLLGYEPEEMVGRVGIDLIHPDDHPLGQRIHELVLGGKETQTITCRCLRKDGSLVWVEATCRSVRDPGTGEVVEIVAASRDVSQRIEAEEALHRHLNILTAVLEGTTDAVFVKDADGRYLLINAAGARFAGRTIEQVVGRDDRALFDEDAARQIMAVDRDVVTRGTTFTGEQAITAGGVTRTCLVTKGPYCDPQGRAIGVIGIARDITQRKRAEELLRQSEERFALALRAATDAVWEYNLETGTVWWNEAYHQAFGPRPASPADAWGWCTDPIHPEDRPRVAASLSDLLAGDGAPWSIEYRCRHADGAYRDMVNRAVIARDASGAPKRIVGAMVDITERKRAELAVQQSEAKVRAVLAAVPDMMFRIRRDGTIAEFKGARGMTPYLAPEEFLGRRITEVLPHPAAGALLAAAAVALETDTLQEIEYELPGADGPESFEARFVALGEEEVLAIVRDVTRRKRAESRSRHLLDELSRVARLTTVGVMASGLAHEINQPLFAISNYVSTAVTLLESKNGDKTATIDHLSKALSQAKAAADVVRRVRRFVAHREPRLSTVDLHAVVREAVSLSESGWEGPRAAIRLELADDLPPLHLDRVLIQQVLVNLIRNAQEAMAETAADARKITIAARRCDAARVSVTVCDNGPGLPPQIAAHLFEVFQSTKAHGLGLGLSISRSIVEAHFGRLTAESNGGRGTTFRFTLPISSPAAAG